MTIGGCPFFFSTIRFTFILSLLHVGKSSFLLALLRLNIITEGDILLDGESLLEMSLEEARDAIAM